jgi:hypothetical protein
MQQMEIRLSKYKGEYPIWLFTEESHLRHSKHLDRKKKGILLQVNIPKEDVLLSNTDAYQMILNDIMLTLDDKEYELIEEGILKMTKEQSWERIFDLELLKNDECYQNSYIQGVTGRIDLRSIKMIKELVEK